MEKADFLRKIMDSVLIYTWVISLSFLGFFVRMLQELNKGKNLSLLGVTTEFSVSAFAGVVVYFITASFDIDPYIQSASIAISGHMGGNVIQIIEDVLVRKIKQ